MSQITNKYNTLYQWASRQKQNLVAIKSNINLRTVCDIRTNRLVWHLAWFMLYFIKSVFGKKISLESMCMQTSLSFSLNLKYNLWLTCWNINAFRVWCKLTCNYFITTSCVPSIILTTCWSNLSYSTRITGALVSGMHTHIHS